MKKMLLFALLFSVPAWAEWYKVTVTRTGSNMYQVVGTQVYVITRACYEWANRDNAVLKYEPNNKWDNKIIFDGGGECQVEKVVS